MLAHVCFSERASRFSAQQIIAILKEPEAGLWTAEVCRPHGISGVRHLVRREGPDLMTMTEVADYLRVRERTVYELVRTRHIPSCKLSGKLLFPKRLIELWVAQSADYPHAAADRLAAKRTLRSPFGKARPMRSRHRSGSAPAGTSSRCNGSVSTSLSGAWNILSSPCNGCSHSTRSDVFREQAELPRGYNVSNAGSVVFNARR